MTKKEIKEKLYFMEEYCKGMARNEAHKSDDVMDYFQGRAQVYEEMYQKLCDLDVKI